MGRQRTWAEEPEKVLGRTVSRGPPSSDTGGFNDVKLYLKTSHKAPLPRIPAMMNVALQ